MRALLRTAGPQCEPVEMIMQRSCPSFRQGLAEDDRHRPRKARTSKPVGRSMTAQILRDGASWRRYQLGARGGRKLEKCVLQSTVNLQFRPPDNGGVPVGVED